VVELRPRMNPIAFLKEVKSELDKVVWPTRDQTIQLTVLVVGISVGVGIFTGGLDFLLTSALDKLLIK
jgi:preprotein translocase subunit SecE